jgi:hypothetical protein
VIALQFANAAFTRKFGYIISQSENPVAILMGAGREVGNLLKTHFRAKDKSSANKLSERRSHFWLQVARAVSNPEQTGYNAITVTITDPRFAQRLFGGTIHAKNAGALTIPVEERAYGRTAAVFERETGLKLFLVKTGGSDANSFENAVLAVKENENSKAFTVEYLLTPSVSQEADPDALPQKAVLENAVIRRAQRVLDRQIADNNANII